MKLASLKEGGRDGTLIVVSRDLTRAVRVPDIAPTLQRALEDWSNLAPRLNNVSEVINQSGAETINGEPVFVTPDELGDAWRDSKLHRPLLTHINGEWFGAPEAGVDMQFNFAQLIAHAAKTRPLSTGTIVGSGTVANEDTALGASCFAERRTVETLRDGKPSTPFMKFGDVVRIEMLDRSGASVFGAIEQKITAAGA